MDSILKIFIGSLVTVGISTVIGLLIYFLKNSLKDSKDASDKNQIRIKSLEDKVGEVKDDLTTSLQEIKDDVRKIDIKQEKLNFLSEKVNDIHVTVKANHNDILSIKDNQSRTQNDVHRLWDVVKRLQLQVTAVTRTVEDTPEIDITEYLNSIYLDSEEKNDIQKFAEYCRIHEPWRVNKFKKKVENRIQFKKKIAPDFLSNIKTGLDEKITTEEEYESEFEMEESVNPTYDKVSSSIKDNNKK